MQKEKDKELMSENNRAKQTRIHCRFKLKRRFLKYEKMDEENEEKENILKRILFLLALAFARGP